MSAKVLVVPVLILFGALIYSYFIPNFDIELVRNIPIDAPAAQVEKALFSLREWPRWHHNIKAITGEPKVGSRLTFHFVSLIKPWKHHELEVEIKEWDLKTGVRVALVGDSSFKLQKVVTGLEWAISLRGNILHSEVKARTLSMRARFFSLFMPRILLHQMLYANVIALSKGAATAPQAFSLNPTPPN